jgi:hypothetical protein
MALHPGFDIERDALGVGTEVMTGALPDYLDQHQN